MKHHHLDLAIRASSSTTTRRIATSTSASTSTPVETAKPMGAAPLRRAASSIARTEEARRSVLLNNTDMPAILIETCFVDEQPTPISAIGSSTTSAPPSPTCWLATRGGGVATASRSACAARCPGSAARTTRAWHRTSRWPSSTMSTSAMFLPEQPPNTSGLARRLDPRSLHRDPLGLRQDATRDAAGASRAGAFAENGQGADCISRWGHMSTPGRRHLAGPDEALGIQTDDEVEVVFPYIRHGYRPPFRPKPWRLLLPPPCGLCGAPPQAHYGLEDHQEDRPVTKVRPCFRSVETCLASSTSPSPSPSWC